VVIEADQEGASVSLPASWLTPGGDGRYLLWPGSYEVLIEAPGYQPLGTAIVVESGGRAEFDFKLAELPGRVVVITNPESPGEVWVGDQQVGTLPGPAILLDKGSYELRVRAPRFLEYIRIIEVAGRDELQEIAVELVPGWADVTVTSDPPEASIFSADELLGETPATVELLAGNQQIELRKTGYKSVQRMLNIVAGQPEELPLIALQESGGLLEITSTPSGAAVTIGKEFIGNTPLQYEAPKGRDYRVKFSMAGYETASRNVDVLDGTGVMLNVKLKPKMGKIKISATPADASLYVDGKSVGSASQEIELIAVPHMLEVRKPGFAAWSARVTPKPGLPQSIDVRLLTPQQAVVAAIPKTVKTYQDQVLRLIEPGSFTMGAPRREQGRRPNEVRRDVQLTRRFYVGVQEVTNREFREFSPRHTSGAEKYRELAADEHPAVMVSWEEAAAYCNWLSDRDGLERAYVKAGGRFVLADPVTDGYRLPTEAEWAWVARFMGGGGELKYPWGTGMPPPADAGNYADSTAIDVASNVISSYSDGYPVTAPAGSFPPNSIGLYDLGGNVAEWVNDRYSVSASNGGRLIDPVGSSDGQYHVIRGSSWRQSSISELRLAYRDFGDRGRLDVGFRIARYTPQPN
jgi:formylglycine-generating enzyme required for sulfatase activity